MSDSTGKIFEFDDFRLIPDEGLLLRAGEEVQLPPKSFAMLVMLVESHGRLIRKNDILDRVWGETFVEEGVIPQSISSIRNALGENPKAPLYIRTEPKRGYRFIGDVRVFAGTDAPADPEPLDEPFAIGSIRFRDESTHFDAGDLDPGKIGPSTDEVPAYSSGYHPDSAEIVNSPGSILGYSRVFPRPAFTLGFLLLAVFGIVALYYSYLSGNTAVAHESGHRIAVLPLKPVDSDKRDRSLEFAIVDSLILKLSESQKFDVKRLNTVRKFIDLEDDPIDAGRELNVDYVLSSHYQVVDGGVRVTSQLLNVATGSTETTVKSETELASLFDIQDAIANEIGDAVLTKFGAPTNIFASRRGTENEEAYSLYQQAWYLIDKGTAEESAKAAKLLDRAVELDPDYSQAWAVRSHAYCQFAHLGGSEPLSVFATAEPMLERSLSLDPNNAMAHTIRGTINRDFHWNFPQAIDDLQQAIKLDPSVVLAHRVLAGAYYRNGQFAEAVESEKRAIDLHPTSIVDHWFLGNYLVAAGRKAEGIAQLHRVAEMDPKYASVYMSLWEIYHLEGDHAKAYENFIKMKEAFGSPSEDIATLKRAYETGGWNNVLRAELDWLLSKEPKGKYCNYKYYIAAVAALSGNKELAFTYLEQAIKYRLIAVSFMKVDPKLRSLRSDPRYTAITERIGLSGRS